MRTVSTEQFVKSIKAGKVSSVLPMIAEKANKCWNDLPAAERTVHSLSDLIQEGINHTVVVVAHKFDLERGTAFQTSNRIFKQGAKKQGVKFTTYLFTALDNHYADIIRSVYREKRCAEHGVLSADSTRISTTQGFDMLLCDVLKRSRKTSNNEDIIVSRIDAERIFLKIYTQASPRLRRYLIKWLIQPTPGRFKKGADFNAAKLEYRKVARPMLTSDLCHTIQTDYMCRANIVRQIALNFSTQRKKSQKGFTNSEEFALAPIITYDMIEHLSQTAMIG